MSYEKVKHLKNEDFKRLCGVQIETFNQMIQLIKNGMSLKKKTGRPSKLSIENQLLMTLEYLREYRTYFHIGQSWGVDESTAYRITQKIENILIKSKELRLPGKKKLHQADNQIEIVVVDVTETPIEKPKKKQKHYYSGKKKDIQ
jgi:hypothetical protein